MAKRNLNYLSYLAPKYWLLWGLLLCARIIAILPLRVQYCLGRLLGWVAFHMLKRRREIAERNIRACFPELTEAEQYTLVRQSFRSNGIGLVESLRSWFVSPKTLAKQVRFHGLEHLEQALSKGRGVILLGGHFSTLDLVGSLTTLSFRSDVLQRDHSNPLFNAFMTRSRQSLYGKVISKQDIRAMFRSLRDNHVVWYATDQDYGRRNTVFSPFFGVACSTLLSTSKFAKKSGAVVIPFSHYRDEKSGTYDIYLAAGLTDFPSGSATDDAARLNMILERNIRKAPEQYLWMHRRFKTCPEKGQTNIYGQPSH